MFTIDQIQESRSKIKSGVDFPAHVKALITMGVTGYSLFLSDRHAEYYGKRNFSIKEDAKYPEYDIAIKADAERFKNILTTFQQGKMSYVNFCEQLARAGVEKWAVDVKKMTCTYYDVHGIEMFVEQVPKA